MVRRALRSMQAELAHLRKLSGAQTGWNVTEHREISVSGNSVESQVHLYIYFLRDFIVHVRCQREMKLNTIPLTLPQGS